MKEEHFYVEYIIPEFCFHISTNFPSEIRSLFSWFPGIRTLDVPNLQFSKLDVSFDYQDNDHVWVCEFHGFRSIIPDTSLLFCYMLHIIEYLADTIINRNIGTHCTTATANTTNVDINGVMALYNPSRNFTL